MRKLLALLALLPAFAFAGGDGISCPINFASPPVLGSAVPNAVNGTTGTWSGLQAVTVSSGYAATFMSGNVGIGTTAPGYKLDIATAVASDHGVNIAVTSGSGTNYGVVSQVTGAATNNTGLYGYATGATNNYGIRIPVMPAGANNWAIYADAAAKSYIAGNVGIGTTTPAGMLSVGASSQFQVSSTGGITGTSFGYANILMSAVAPTISSGFGTGASLISNNGTATFRINVGTGGIASSGVIGLTTANGWNCQVSEFNPNATALLSTTVVTASTTTSVTVTNELLSTGAVTAWQASQVLMANCMAY